jgi:acetyl-CoA carboxylase biotin carboxyl carrier protein
MTSKINHQELLKLIDLMEERNLAHLEIEVEGLKISLSKNQGLSDKNGLRVDHDTELDVSRVASPHEPDVPANESGLHIVTSPMVGTFYRASDPSSPPFVEQGDTVKKNQTLCIIEAMKLMNEIEADIDGIVDKVYIKNGKPVEYGQKLFAIKAKS